MGFTIITLSAGVIWSSVIAFLAAGFITKPLQKLERVALKAANGDIREDAEISKIDDEIRSLGIAFNHMLFNLRNMVLNIDENFKETNEKVNTISAVSSKAAEQADGISRTILEITLGADTSAVSIQTLLNLLKRFLYLRVMCRKGHGLLNRSQLKWLPN